MNKDAIILFIKYPERGGMKTRLAEEIGEDLAFDLTICFMRDIVNTLHSVEAETIIIGTGSTGKGPPGIFGRSLRLVQRGHDPGERLYNAFADVFIRGISRAVLVGGDCPGLSASYVREAFAELDSHDAVIGPVADGGYYLIGLHDRSLSAEYFRDISWGTSKVLVQTVGKMEDAFMELSLLPQIRLVNSVEDLRFLVEERAVQARNTLQFIELNRDKLDGML